MKTDAFTQGFIDGVTRQSAERQAQIVRGLQFVRILLETIEEAGPDGAPEGMMYAAVMTAGYSLETFQSAMALLAKRGLIRRSGHVAYYVPPSDNPVRS